MAAAAGGAGVRGPHPSGVPGDGGQGQTQGGQGQVMIHWKHNGPSVQPLNISESRAGQRSAGEDDDPDDEDDELLAPAPPRERLSYTRYQLELLNGIFGSVRYPNSVQKQLIAKRVGISREQVKIWFQNRRRKDVVGNKGAGPAADTDTSNSSPPGSTSPATPSASSPSTTSTAHGAPPPAQGDSDSQATDTTDKSGQDPTTDSGKRRSMVPEAVINGCISELHRFSDEKLKERKEKRKAKGKRRSHSSSASSSGSGHHHQSAQQASRPSAPSAPPPATSRLFQAYDMIAPPNKVTPTAAFLDTSANRFNHSQNTSAFSSPRDQLTVSTMPVHRLSWDGLDPAGAYGGLGSAAGLGMSLAPSSQAQAVMGVGVSGPQDTLPVLSDLLTTYRQHVDPGGGGGSAHHEREAALPQASVLSSSSSASATSPGARDPVKLLDLGAFSAAGGFPPPPSPFALNRMYHHPFVADAPIMLSSLTQPHPHPHHPWPHHHHPPTPIHPQHPSSHSSLSHFNSVAAMNHMDPYKTVRISSLTNPYFSSPPPPPTHHPHWSHPPGTDPTTLGTSFTQL